MESSEQRLARVVRAALARTGEAEAAFAQRAGITTAVLQRALAGKGAAQSAEVRERLLGALPKVEQIVARHVLAQKPPAQPGTKLRVFLSSTHLDQKQRRETVAKQIVGLGLEVVCSESFVAVAQPVLETCVRQLCECDVYVGILAHRYGSEPAGEKRSFTEIEYDVAGLLGLNRLMFLVDPDRQQMSSDADPDRTKQQKLAAFKARIQETPAPPFAGDGELIGQVMNSLVKWLGPRGPKTSPALPEPDPHAEELSRYRDLVLAEHSLLKMVGFVGAVRARIQTAALYVALKAVWHRSAEEGASAEQEFEKAGKDAHGNLQHAEGLDMPKAFRLAKQHGCRCLAVVGHPGSGKTTHLKRLAVAAVQQGGDKFDLPAGAVPILVPLRDLTAADLSQPLQHWIQRTLPQNHRLPDTFGEWLVGQDEHPLLLLVDGLDEAPKGARTEVARRVGEWTRERPDRYTVLTSRFAGYDAAARKALGAGALHLELQPFSESQTEEFVQNWYRIVECEKDRIAGIGRGEAAANDLIGRLRQPAIRNSRVAALTANPLLLTIICLIHHDTNRLPEKREQLYRQCVQVLLERWRKPDGGGLEHEAALQVLLPAARFLHEVPERTHATAAELTPELAEPLAVAKWPGDAEHFLATIRDDCGLLTGHGPDAFGFLHLGFQEYLAARAIEEDLVAQALEEAEDLPQTLDKLAARFGVPWWREVILLFLASAKKAMFRRFFRHLVQHASFSQNESLVHECLDEAGQPCHMPFLEFLERSAKEPPSDELEARQIVALHALRVLKPDAVPALEARYQDHASDTLWAEVFGRQRTRIEVEMVRARVGVPPVQVGKHQIVWSSAAKIPMVLIPGGTFEMGQRPGESGDPDELPLHKVAVPAFLLAQTPITNAQYRVFVEATGHASPDTWRDRRFQGDDQPVVGVSRKDAQEFCTWAGLRLPSEAEWEYACRAGTKTRFWAGSEEQDLARVAWYDENSEGRTQPVGLKPANAFGLHDMHGNVWEWCEDEWHGNYRLAPTDGSPWLSGRSDRGLVRGGSWDDPAWWCRSASRRWWHPDVRIVLLGFRPASSFRP